MTALLDLLTSADADRLARVFCDKPGLYAVRMAKGAVEYPLEITHRPTPDPATGEINWERPHWWEIRLCGELIGEPSISFPCERDWFGRPIDDAEFQYLLAHRTWARDHAPDRAEAHAYRPVDFLSTPPVF